MTTIIRGFVAVQIALFALGAIVHSGLVGQPRDPGAAIAESVIALVLVAGLAISLRNERATPRAALAAQGFALLGTLVGITLVLTVGPTKALDVGLHLTMLATLVSGLLVTWRADGNSAHSPLHLAR